MYNPQVLAEQLCLLKEKLIKENDEINLSLKSTEEEIKKKAPVSLKIKERYNLQCKMGENNLSIHEINKVLTSMGWSGYEDGVHKFKKE
jgi:hypothetical protein